jgi:hypothetical protein
MSTKKIIYIVTKKLTLSGHSEIGLGVVKPPFVESWGDWAISYFAKGSGYDVAQSIW